MREPLTPKQMASQIDRAVVTNLDSGETSELAVKPDSTCLFFEPFEVGGYRVQLRLDWSDPDCHGHPRLDADFLDPATGRHHRSMRGHPAHHTDSTNATARTYKWLFKDASLRFRVAITWSASVSIANVTSMSATADVIRAPRDQQGMHG